MFFPSIGRGWRPRSSWKLPSSHPGCRAIQALKELSECLKGAEEGWEFLSHSERSKDINFNNRYVFPPLFLSRALVNPFQLGGTLLFFCIQALEIWAESCFCFFVFASCCLWDFGSSFFGRYVWRGGWSLKQEDGTDVSCGCVSGLLVCVYDQGLQIYSMLEEMELWQEILPKFFLRNPLWDLDWIRVAVCGLLDPRRVRKMISLPAFWTEAFFCCNWLLLFIWIVSS